MSSILRPIVPFYMCILFVSSNALSTLDATGKSVTVAFPNHTKSFGRRDEEVYGARDAVVDTWNWFGLVFDGLKINKLSLRVYSKIS